MLDEDLRAQLKSYLERLRRSVVLTGLRSEGSDSSDLEELLSQIAATSDLVTAEVSSEAPEGWPENPAFLPRRPSFAIQAAGETSRVNFAGLPLGHEFTSLVLALLQVGGHPPRVSDEVLERVDALEGPLHFETYYSQSCQVCPDVVQALNLLAARNPAISHVAIDGATFASEVEEREILAVPSVWLNGERFTEGRVDLDDILARLETSVETRTPKRDRDRFDMLIVGGGPAGAAAAVYAARKGLTTGIVTDRFGGQLLDTLGVDNFISVLHTEGPQLASALEAHVADYEVEVIKRESAKRLIPGDEISIELASGETLRARSVVLAPGASWRNMDVRGESEYRTRGVTYCPHCDGPLFKDKRVAVVGGGNSGAEAAIDLSGIASHVTLLEFLDDLKADEVLRQRLESLPNVDVITSARTTEVVGDGKRVTGLNYEDRTTGTQNSLETSGVFVQIGLLPNTDWLEDTVERTSHGEIVVGLDGRTNVPGVYAAGDATTTPYKQIIIAAGEGAKAALGAFDYLIRKPSDEAN